MKKKILSLITCLAMVLTIMPMSVLAEENNITYIDRSWTDGNVYTHEENCVVDEFIESTTTELKDGKWYAVKGDITINNPILASGNINLILCDDATLTLKMGTIISGDITLNIYGQSGDSGKLLASSTVRGTIPIGKANMGSINMYGGTVTSNGEASSSAAISISNFNMYGGTVNAIGGVAGAGIGGSENFNGGNFTMYGGTVNAKAGYAFSQAHYTPDGLITIVEGGAGIGGGNKGSAGDFTYYGGTVNAVGADQCPAIGSGTNGNTHGSFNISDVAIIKAGDASADTIVTSEEYAQNRKRYITIEENAIAKGENWYIDLDNTLHITGEVKNVSTTTDYTPWKEYKSQIKAVVTKDGAKVKNCDRLFSNCTNLKSVDISNLDITNTTKMRYMFSGCSSLETLDLSGLDTSAVTSMMCMFYNASSLKSINLDGWNTVNVNDMQYMFNNCASLTELDLSNFDTSKVTNMYTMFYKCSKLEKLDIGNFSGDSLTTTDFVLSSCPALAEISVNGSIIQKLAEPVKALSSVWYCNDTHKKYTTADELMTITEKVTLSKTIENITEGTGWYIDGIGCLHISGAFNTWNNVNPEWYEYRDEIYSVVAEEGAKFEYTTYKMFAEYNNLTTVDLHLAKLSSLSSISYMFLDCKKLESVNISGWDASSTPIVISGLFQGCSALKNVDMSGTKLSTVENNSKYVFNDCTQLNKISMEAKIAKLFAEQLITIWPSWKNSEDGTVYKSVEDFKAITNAVSLTRECDHNWVEANCATPKHCTLCGLTEGSINKSAHIWAEANCTTPKTCSFCGFSEGEINPDNHIWGDTAEKAVKVCENCGFVQGDGWYILNDGTLYIVGDVHNQYSVPWNSCYKKIKKVKTLEGAKIENGYGLFECENLTEADLSKLDTSECKTMEKMFEDCRRLTKLDISSFDTSNVTNMIGMFENCQQLKELDLSSFDTSNVTSMNSMFKSCSILTKLDLSKFNTSSVTDMNSMFENCQQLTKLDLSSFNTSNITSMNSMFKYCDNLSDLDISSFKTGKVTDMNNMFYGCYALTELDLSHFDFSSLNSAEYMFYVCTQLTKLDLGGFHADNVTSTRYMFGLCEALSNINLSGFNTAKVNNMADMFAGCKALTELDLSGFDTSSVTDMIGMFYGCSSLKELDLSSFDTSSATDMYTMFYGCSSLKELDLSNFNTSSATNIYGMFQGCSSLVELDLSNFDTSSVINMKSMFQGCSSLVELDLSSFNTANVKSMNKLFENCTALKKLDISNFNCDNILLDFYTKGNVDVFNGCSALDEVKINGNALQMLAEPVYGNCNTWYANDIGEKYTSVDELKAVEGKVTLSKTFVYVPDEMQLAVNDNEFAVTLKGYDAKTGIVIVGLYDNNELLEAKLFDISKKEIPQGSFESDGKVRAFWWSGIDNLIPMCDFVEK